MSSHEQIEIHKFCCSINCKSFSTLLLANICTIFLRKMPNFREILRKSVRDKKENFRSFLHFFAFCFILRPCPTNPDRLIFFKMFINHMNPYNTKSLFMSARADLSSKFPISYLNPIFHNKPYEFSPS